MKQCSKCGEIKPASEFYAAAGTRDGLRGECKACFAARSKKWYAANRTRVIARVKRWQHANPERHRETQKKVRARRRDAAREDHLRRTFGIETIDYQELLDRQGGGCAICGRKPRAGSSLHVDHDHETGRIRGLLCFRCNGGLGQFADSLDRLATAIGYLAGRDELHEVTVSRAQALRAA